MPKPTGYAFNLMHHLKKLGSKLKPEFKFRNGHADISIPESKLLIEVDGEHHLTDPQQIVKDLKREESALKDGFATIHVSNHDIYKNVGGIASGIVEAAEIRKEDINNINS